MPDGNCDAACVKIIIDGGALAGEAAALYEAAPRGSKIAQEAFALMQQMTAEAMIAQPITCGAKPNVRTALAAMSQDQCDFADTIRTWRDGVASDINSHADELRTRRLRYHYFLRDIALGEEPTWPPTSEV